VESSVIEFSEQGERTLRSVESSVIEFLLGQVLIETNPPVQMFPNCSYPFISKVTHPSMEANVILRFFFPCVNNRKRLNLHRRSIQSNNT
ncbi:hypothetical protein QMM85_13760, partial [Leptospira santarosai]|uniref:hypothetical protein n=1 Tax=Leptospira santarosai TaxID=28183 RepID=UPI0024AFEECA